MTERVLDLRSDTGVGIDQLFIDRGVPRHCHGLHGLGDRCQLGGTGHCFLEHAVVIGIDGSGRGDVPRVLQGVCVQSVERVLRHLNRELQDLRRRPQCIDQLFQQTLLVIRDRFQQNEFHRRLRFVELVADAHEKTLGGTTDNLRGTDLAGGSVTKDRISPGFRHWTQSFVAASRLNQRRWSAPPGSWPASLRRSVERLSR
ncbi:hypothetical protein [Yimella lutea]|uniref:hypothetical protein n=1 Tax=Yimella lutea TaxID=587872 RepID=UPI001153F350|nr:hypothetical protein [Yimella lutea]